MTTVLRTLPPLDQFDAGLAGVAPVTRLGVSYADADATNVQAKATTLGILLATGYAPGYQPGSGSATAVRGPLIVGFLSQRPSPAEVAIGQEYQAIDDNGGTRYRSDGSTWVPQAAAVGSVAKGSIVTATNATGTATASGSVINTLVTIPGTGFTIPANTIGDVWVEYQGDYLCGATAGEALLCLVEVTGSATIRASVVSRIAGDSSVGSFPQKAFQIGAVSTARSFQLQEQFITAGAQFSMLNTGTNPTYATVVSR